MNDIYDIKGNLIVSFISEGFFVFIAVIIILGVIIYIFYLNKDKIIKKQENKIISLERKPFLKKIKMLKIDDLDFFEVLSYIVRLYIKERGIIFDAVNKTNKEITDYFIQNKKFLFAKLRIDDNDFVILNNFLNLSYKYQFSNIECSDDEKIILKDLAKEIVNKF